MGVPNRFFTRFRAWPTSNLYRKTQKREKVLSRLGELLNTLRNVHPRGPRGGPQVRGGSTPNPQDIHPLRASCSPPQSDELRVWNDDEGSSQSLATFRSKLAHAVWQGGMEGTLAPLSIPCSERYRRKAATLAEERVIRLRLRTLSATFRNFRSCRQLRKI